MRKFLVLAALLLATPSVAADGASIEGIYDRPDGTSFIIAPFEPEPGSKFLSYLEPDTGRFAVLRSDKEDFVAEAQIFPNGGAYFLTLHASGDGLDCTPATGAKSHARQRKLTLEPYAFTSGNATLHGTLIIPAGNRPHPAIVALHGSGPLTRWAAGPFQYYFAYLGYAVLAFDKRSTGESASAPEVSNILALADDGIAAAQSLSKRSDIRRDRIGIWGPSQGGFLSLVAAARSKDIAFAIDQSGMLVPAWRQNIYQAGAEARAEGLGEADAERARAYMRHVMDVARSGKGWKALEPEIAATTKAPWGKFVTQPKDLASLRALWRSDFSMDPTAELSRIRVPVLAVFGSLDISTPVPESVASLHRAIRPASNLTVVVVKGADHPLLIAQTGSFSEIPNLSHIAPDALAAEQAFLEKMAR